MSEGDLGFVIARHRADSHEVGKCGERPIARLAHHVGAGPQQLGRRHVDRGDALLVREREVPVQARRDQVGARQAVAVGEHVRAGGRHGVTAGLEDDRIDVLVAEMPTQGKPGDARTDDQHVGRQCQAQGDE